MKVGAKEVQFKSENDDSNHVVKLLMMDCDWKPTFLNEGQAKFYQHFHISEEDETYIWSDAKDRRILCIFIDPYIPYKDANEIWRTNDVKRQ